MPSPWTLSRRVLVPACDVAALIGDGWRVVYVDPASMRVEGVGVCMEWSR